MMGIALEPRVQHVEQQVPATRAPPEATPPPSTSSATSAQHIPAQRAVFTVLEIPKIKKRKTPVLTKEVNIKTEIKTEDY